MRVRREKYGGLKEKKGKVEMDKSEEEDKVELRGRILDYFSLVHKVSLFFCYILFVILKKNKFYFFIYCTNAFFNLQIYIQNLISDAIVQVKIEDDAQPDY